MEIGYVSIVQLYKFHLVQFFPGPKIHTKWGPPVIETKLHQFSKFVLIVKGVCCHLTTYIVKGAE